MKNAMVRLLSILVGNLLIAFAVSTLMLDHAIVVGGVSGRGVVAQSYLGIPVSLGVALANGSLFVAGWLVLGRAFALTTLGSTLVFPLFLRLFERLDGLQGWMPDSLAAGVIAGCLIGLGIGLVIRVGASTGGVDILALILNKKYRIPVHISLYAIDLTVLLLQIPLRDVLQIFYGLVATALSSMVLNKTLTAGSSLSQILVVSDRYEAIRDAVLHQLDVGVTLLASEKGYSGQRSRILLTVVPYRKLPALRACINGIDPMAFVIVSHVDEVGGQGFSLARL